MIAKIVICNNLVVKNDYLFVLIQIFGKKLHLCTIINLNLIQVCIAILKIFWFRN